MATGSVAIEEENTWNYPPPPYENVPRLSSPRHIPLPEQFELSLAYETVVVLLALNAMWPLQSDLRAFA